MIGPPDRTHLKPPPPPRTPQPVHFEVPAGQRLTRLFDPTLPHKPAPLTFRRFGPLERFDHHRPEADLSPREDSDRGVWYGSHDDLACALVEVFGDDWIVVLEPWHMARPLTTSPLRLLDLRQSSAMAAGTFTEIASSGNAVLTWEWARYFYDETGAYGELDGLTWAGAHNGGHCVLLFDRAQARLACDDCSLPLSDPLLQGPILEVVRDHNMCVAKRPV